MRTLLHLSRQRLSRRRHAYTLVEIMLVLSIIVVLMSAGIYYLVGNLEVAKNKRVKSDIEAISTQLKVYQMNNLNFPTNEGIENSEDAGAKSDS